MWTEIAIVLALIVANGLFAGAEIAIIALRKSRLDQLVEEGRAGARSVLALREQPERFLATVQIGITVVGAAAAVVGGASLAARLTPALQRVSWIGTAAEDVSLAIVIALVSYLSLVFGELVPKSLALRASETYALLVARPLRALAWVARPLVWLLTGRRAVQRARLARGAGPARGGRERGGARRPAHPRRQPAARPRSAAGRGVVHARGVRDRARGSHPAARRAPALRRDLDRGGRRDFPCGAGRARSSWGRFAAARPA